MLLQVSPVASIIASILPLVLLLGAGGLFIFIILKISKKIAKKEQAEFINKKQNQNNNS